MYSIDYSNLKKNKNVYMIFLIAGIILLTIMLLMVFLAGSVEFLLAIMVPIIFLGLSIPNIIKMNKKIEMVKQLNNTGVLFKNVPYTLVRSNIKVNRVRLRKPVLNFYLPGGIPIKLEGDPRHDTAFIEPTGVIDVIIDPNDTTKYYIDFNINRIEGNRPSDYYTQPNQQQTISQSPMSTEIKPL